VLPVLGKFTPTLARAEKEIAEPVYVVKGQRRPGYRCFRSCLASVAASNSNSWINLTSK